MLKEELLSKNFYLDNMSMFLKDSFGMIDREETYRAVLNNINVFADNLISRYDLFNVLFEGDYFERNGIDKDGVEDAVLDNIAAIFGLSRSMNVTYYGIGYANQYYGERGVKYTEPILLTNRELYIYIKIAITKLNFQGTAGEIKNLYYPTGEGDDDVKQLGIYYSWGGTSSSRLPEGYTELEYLEATGTQYIDSGIKCTQEYSVNGKFTIKEGFEFNVFGSRYAADTKNFSACVVRVDGLKLQIDYVSSTANRIQFPIEYGRVIDFSLIGNTSVTINGETVALTPGTFTQDYNFLIGQMGGNPFFTGGLNGRIYPFQMANGTTPVRHFIPAQRSSDNEVGMYDLVTNAFFGNAGTGSFIAGTPVQPTTAGSPLVCNVWLCNTNEIARNNFNSNIVKLFLADELLVESLGIQYIKSLGMSTFAARFDVEGIPDLEHYVYVFDPDFNNQTQDGFKYAVFQ